MFEPCKRIVDPIRSLFDPCRRWKDLLKARAEGPLTATEHCELDHHLMRCARCRACETADFALIAGLQLDPAEVPVVDVESFEAYVIARTREPVLTWGDRVASAVTSLSARRMPRIGLPCQLLGGAACAALLTVWCVMPEGRAVAPLIPTGSRSSMARAADQAGAPPVPLDSLLRTPSPRAALLWTNPREPRRLHSRPASPASSRRHGDSQPQDEKQGMIDVPVNLG